MPKQYFFLKLHPPRSTFMQDMSPAEQEIMKQHVAYWRPYVQEGTMVLMGPVMDPEEGYGIGIAAVDSLEQLLERIGSDPANGLNHYEYHPMRVVSKYIASEQ